MGFDSPMPLAVMRPFAMPPGPVRYASTAFAHLEARQLIHEVAQRVSRHTRHIDDISYGNSTRNHFAALFPSKFQFWMNLRTLSIALR